MTDNTDKRTVEYLPEIHIFVYIECLGKQSIANTKRQQIPLTLCYFALNGMYCHLVIFNGCIFLKIRDDRPIQNAFRRSSVYHHDSSVNLVILSLECGFDNWELGSLHVSQFCCKFLHIYLCIRRTSHHSLMDCSMLNFCFLIC